jgi:hypothetical protein
MNVIRSDMEVVSNLAKFRRPPGRGVGIELRRRESRFKVELVEGGRGGWVRERDWGVSTPFKVGSVEFEASRLGWGMGREVEVDDEAAGEGDKNGFEL